MNNKGWQSLTAAPLPMVLVLFGVLASSGSSAGAQTKVAKQPQKSSIVPSSTKWVEDTITVRVESPYISDSGKLVLAYTVTNKTGQDIDLDFTEGPRTAEPERLFGQAKAPNSSEPHEPIRVFLKLKDTDSYSQVAPKDHFLYFADTLLVSDLPISFHVILTASSEDKPSWFSSESPEDRLRRVLKNNLGNTDSVVIFVPDRHIKITLPVPNGPRK